MLEIVYAENSEQFYLIQKNRFYECSKHIQIYSKHDVQSANFINVETYFKNLTVELHVLYAFNTHVKYCVNRISFTI